jgi:hypothetical protein
VILVINKTAVSMDLLMTPSCSAGAGLQRSGRGTA